MVPMVTVIAMVMAFRGGNCDDVGDGAYGDSDSDGDGVSWRQL